MEKKKEEKKILETIKQILDLESRGISVRELTLMLKEKGIDKNEKTILKYLKRLKSEKVVTED